jgi:ATP10 protein
MSGVLSVTITTGAQTLPQLEARTLSGKTVTLPDALRGHIAVFVVGFSRPSKTPTAAWGKRLAQELAGSNIDVYEAAVLQDVPRFFRGMVTSGIRKSVPAAQHDRFLVLIEKEGEWKKLAKFSEPDAAYVLLVDRAANVVWTTHRPVDDSAIAELRQQVGAITK